MSQGFDESACNEESRIGIVADSPLQRHVLKSSVESMGLQIAYNLSPERFVDMLAHSPGECLRVDLLIVEIEDDEVCAGIIDSTMDQLECPVLFGLGAAPEKHSREYPRWERRLHTKMREHLGDIDKIHEVGASLSVLDAAWSTSEADGEVRPVAGQDGPVEEVWILAASLGGPEAVKAFLDGLPAGLPVAFIYAQHIDANFTPVLARVLGRHSVFSLHIAEPGDCLHRGDVLLVPVDKEMVFDEQGRVAFKPNEWPGPYGPSIDQVLLNTAEYYGSRCHVIFFSGMGNDGAIAAPMLKAYGSNIWLQAPESCANSSMVCSVLDTGCSDLIDTPERLASHFVERYWRSASS